MEDSQIRLQEASRLFNNKHYAECESALRSVATKDLKIQHNLAVAHYLAKGGDVREVLAELAKGSVDESSHSSSSSAPVTLAYEGHEIAHYNRAVLLANQGRCEEAAATLRELLHLHESISPAVLGRCVCLFQLVTNTTPIASAQQTKSTAGAVTKPKSVAQPRSKSDDELVGNVLQLYMDDIKKDPALFRMLQGSLAADGSALHELFKSASTPIERAVYFNDLGVLTMGEGKHQTAALYFAKAHRLISEVPSADTFTKHSILFNIAICSLHRQDYLAALSALLSVQETMQTSASFWLYVAQAALGTFHSSRSSTIAYDVVQQELAAPLSKGSIQSGFVLLQLPNAAATNPSSVLNTTGAGQEQRHATLLLARRAAQNCIQLLGGHSLAATADALYTEGRVQEYRTLQYAFLYNAASALLLQDYAVSIKYAAELLAVHKSRPILPDVQSSALLHIVEAHCRLNKPGAALKALSSASLGELLSSTDRTDGQQKQRTEALFVNLVLVHLGCGNYKQAQSIISTLIPKLTSGASATSASGRTAALLLAYVDLALGNKEKVIEQLSKCTSGVANMVV
jgi:tetratricopeptide (TPR) repeat protein